MICSRPHSYRVLDLSVLSYDPLEEETEAEGGEVICPRAPYLVRIGPVMQIQALSGTKTMLLITSLS